MFPQFSPLLNFRFDYQSSDAVANQRNQFLAQQFRFQNIQSLSSRYCHASGELFEFSEPSVVINDKRLCDRIGQHVQH